MRRLFLIAGLMTALGLAVVAASAFAPANFAGTWSLDKTKSQGLDPRMQNAESVTWTITQDDKQISIDSKVVAGPPPAGATGGPGGGGGGMGGGRGPTGPRVFSLDGKEATAEAQGGTNTTKTTWSGDGKTLELSAASGRRPHRPAVKNTSPEKKRGSGGGKARSHGAPHENPRGGITSRPGFNKQNHPP